MEDDGSRKQEAFQGNPLNRQVYERMFFPLRGRIMPNGVKYVDGDAKQVLVDVYLYDLFPAVSNVPVMASKINAVNGDYMDPEPGDLVAVSFFGGNFRDPVVVGFLPTAGNDVQSTAAEAPQSRRVMNGTIETIEKNGTRRLHVAASNVLEAVTDWLMTALNGVATLIAKGKITIKSSGGGTVEVDGVGSGAVKGIVQGDCLCSFTGKPHPHISASVKGSK